MLSDFPYTRDLVLIGGGHTHALVMKKWAMKPLDGARLTVINPDPVAAYTGMLPGHIAGHYSQEELEIDLVRLARSCNARIVLGHAVGIDLGSKRISVQGRADISYDIASLDIGIESEIGKLRGSASRANPVKPMSRFAESWTSYIDGVTQGAGSPSAVVIGVGVGGTELAMAMAHRLQSLNVANPLVTLVESSNRFLTELNRGVRSKLLRSLDEFGIAVECPAEVQEISADSVRLSNGKVIPCGFAAFATGGRPAKWLSQTGLDLKDGCIIVDQHLRTPSNPNVFAVGDCAHMSGSPRPKAGVFAVRQAPVLWHNLISALSGEPLRGFRPQKDFLKLISCGSRRAVAEKHGLSVEGGWVWKVKDRVDRKFIRKFLQLPEMPPPAIPARSATGIRELLEESDMLCGGCGSKAGRASLNSGLLPAVACKRNDVVLGIGDDAAVLRHGDGFQVIATDHMRAFIEDYWLFSRIAAMHSLGDIWAMGATPQSALATVILPRMPDRMISETLREIMHAAAEVFNCEGADIVGGHTSQGAELTIGFTVTGTRNGRIIGKGGAQPGDKLVITRALGTGTVLAGDMSRLATGREVETALAQMSRASGHAARILAESATAMTDVTGFGLAGHLMEILESSRLSASIEVNRIPFLPGAERLASEGVRSTIWKSNAAIAEKMSMPEGTRAGLLFDPQTAGGLLVAIPAEQESMVCRKLQDAGEPAVCIGEVGEGEAWIHVT